MDFMFKERKIYWEFVGNAEHLGEYGNILIGGMRISEELCWASLLGNDC